MRIALVHYWLLGHRGGEKVLEAICRIFPYADIFTLFYEPERVSPLIRSKRVIASYLNPLRSMHRSLLPLMPMALESFDLRDYDVVISSESGPAKGVLTPARSRHICYCHTPMRYLWELYPAYLKELRPGPIRGALMAPVANYLRVWDYASAARVDAFIANSRNVKQRIRRSYRRQARVVYPPVSTSSFSCGSDQGYFLIVSELVGYKRLDYAIRTFGRSGRRLKVVGDGPEYKRLTAGKQANIEFCGRVPDAQLRELYAGCTAFVMPGEEDFGITMVESLASGKPVVALGRGGALEILGSDCGLLYFEPTESALEDALHGFERSRGLFRPARLQRRALAFSEAVFERKFRAELRRHGLDESYHDPSGEEFEDEPSVVDS